MKKKVRTRFITDQKNRVVWVLFLMVTPWSISEAAAQQQFYAGLQLGLVASQLDGDNYTGFDKIGWRIGVRAGTKVGQQTEISIELNYEEKGSRFESNDGRPLDERNRIIELVYAEIPVLVRWYHKKQQRLFFESGLALSYLIESRFQVKGNRGDLSAFESIAPEFQRSEINFILGLGHQFTSNLAGYLRTSIGLLPFYKNETPKQEEVPFTPRPFGIPPPEIVNHLRNYLISAGFSYIF